MLVTRGSQGTTVTFDSMKAPLALALIVMIVATKIAADDFFAKFVAGIAVSGNSDTGDQLAVHGQKHAQRPWLSRKLLQCYCKNNCYCNGRNANSDDLQLARNQQAIINSQQAISAAYQSGANRYVTEGATYYAQDQAWQAAQGIRPYPYGRWGHWSYYGRRQ